MTERRANDWPPKSGDVHFERRLEFQDGLRGLLQHAKLREQSEKSSSVTHDASSLDEHCNSHRIAKWGCALRFDAYLRRP